MYYFVSDNSFFLYGLENALSGTDIGEQAIYVNINNDVLTLSPPSDDVVILAICNLAVRRVVMRKPEVALCRLIIMVPSELYLNPGGAYIPWIASCRVTIEMFVQLLLQIVRVRVKWHQIPLKETEVLFYLGAGFSHEEVSELLCISVKYIYAIRRKINLALGLNDCNSAASILLSRDVAEMRMSNRRHDISVLWRGARESMFFR